MVPLDVLGFLKAVLIRYFMMYFVGGVGMRRSANALSLVFDSL